MAQIPIDRFLKLILLRWLKEGINESELNELAYKYAPTEDEAKEDAVRLYDKLFDNGMCNVLKSMSKCNPEVEPGYYFGRV